MRRKKLEADQQQPGTVHTFQVAVPGGAPWGRGHREGTTGSCVDAAEREGS